MTAGHIIFIPGALMIGMFLGFILGTRAARNQMELHARRTAEREAARAARAAKRAGEGDKAAAAGDQAAAASARAAAGDKAAADDK